MLAAPKTPKKVQPPKKCEDPTVKALKQTKKLLKEMKRDHAELYGWLCLLGRFVDPEDGMLIRKENDNFAPNDPSEDYYKITFATSRNEYHITAKPHSYLGATATCRQCRVGESWKRGNDLHDGPFCYGTWVGILSDIIGYEMVSVSVEG